MGGKLWTENEDTILIKSVENDDMTIGDIYKSKSLPRRTYQAIADRRNFLLKKNILNIDHEPRVMKKWTTEDIWKAWIYYHTGFSNREIGSKLERNPKSVASKISNEGLIWHPPNKPCPDTLKEQVNELLEKMNSK